MRHPFDLSLTELQAIDLDFVEPLTATEAAQVGGSSEATTLALGEEGGEPITTKALNEGGEATTLALGEEGGYYPHPRPRPRPPKPHPDVCVPIYTTLALGEEGGTG